MTDIAGTTVDIQCGIEKFCQKHKFKQISNSPIELTRNKIGHNGVIDQKFSITIESIQISVKIEEDVTTRAVLPRIATKIFDRFNEKAPLTAGRSLEITDFRPSFPFKPGRWRTKFLIYQGKSSNTITMPSNPTEIFDQLNRELKNAEQMGSSLLRSIFYRFNSTSSG